MNAPPIYPKKLPCYDWIFSSASNVHIAVDRASFKTYIPFRTYVLAIADQRQVPAKGIGTVELRIRRQPGTKEGHKILLENVLHIPSWICNIFSDVHLQPARDFEHDWSDFGVSFQQKKDDKWKPWGYTENFCGLDKLVLSRQLQGRSPMLDDKDREVFSVNVTWPQHQRDKWHMMVDEEEQRIADEKEAKAKWEATKQEKDSDEEAVAGEGDEAAGSQEIDTVDVALQKSENIKTTPIPRPMEREGRSTLMEMDANLRLKRTRRTNSLRVPSRSSFRENLLWRKTMDGV